MASLNHSMIAQMFSVSAQIGDIVRKKQVSLPRQPLLDTQRQCRLNTINTGRFNLHMITRWAGTIQERKDDAQVKTNRDLRQEIFFDFVLSTLTWCELLPTINNVGQSLQELQELALTARGLFRLSKIHVGFVQRKWFY